MDSFLQMVKVYKFKAKHEEYFCNKSPLEYKESLSQNFITLLEDRDQRGCRLFLAKMGKLTLTTQSGGFETYCVLLYMFLGNLRVSRQQISHIVSY